MKFFKKENINGVRKAVCKLCPLVSYVFFKNSEIGALTRHIRAKHPQNQSRQTQISIFGGALNTFSYNHQRGKTNLSKYLIKKFYEKNELS